MSHRRDGPVGQLTGLAARALVPSFVLLLLLAVAAGRGSVGGLQEVGVVGSLGGAAWSVVADGDRVYLSAGRRVVVLDLRDPAHPSPMGWSAPVDFHSSPNLALDGGLLRLASSNGLGAVDPRDPPSSPLVVFAPTEREVRAAVFAGGRAYVAEPPPAGPPSHGVIAPPCDPARPSRAGRVRVLDLVDPARPREVSDVPVPCVAPEHLTLDGDRLYGSAGKELYVFVLADPEHPVLVAQATLPLWVLDLAAAGGRLYVADTTGVRVLDGRAPGGPREVGALAWPFFVPTLVDPRRLRVVGDRLYLAAGPGRGVAVVDASDPARPRELGWVRTPGSSWDAAPLGPYLLVADGDRGLRVLDAVDPARAREVGAWEWPARAQGVIDAGRYLYVADETTGLRVLDAVDPARPRTAATLPIAPPPQPPNAVAQGLWRDGDRLYAMNGTAGVGIYDLADPALPKEIGQVALPGEFVRGIVVRDGLAYLALGPAGLRVVDVRDPVRPMLLGALKVPGDAQALALAGPTVYLAEAQLPPFGRSPTGGLRVVDVADPRHPTEVGYLPDDAPPHAVATAGTVVYVAEGPGFGYAGDPGRGGQLRVVDASDPRSPRLLEARATGGEATGLALGGDRLYVADGRAGVVVLDASVPGRPTVVDRIRLPADLNAVGVAAGCRRAVVAGGWDGLLVLKSDACPPLQAR